MLPVDRMGSVIITQKESATGTVSRSSKRLSSQSDMRKKLSKSVAITTGNRLRANLKNEKIKANDHDTKFVLFSD